MTAAVSTAVANLGGFELESGRSLPEVTVAYQTYGRLNAQRSNAVLIEHALTADANAADWWSGVVGPGQWIDTDEYFVVCANTLGGCSGTTGPTSVGQDGLPYGSRFPRVSIRDMVRVEIALSDSLGIDAWHAVIGGSMGGARALEFALEAPDRVERTAVLAAPAFSQADQIAWAHTQIQAIMMDADYCGGDYLALGRFPACGLGLARQIAHLTYRADLELNHRFGSTLQPRDPAAPPEDGPCKGESYYAIQSYLDHQAGKLVGRFDPQSYITLAAALRDHDVRRGRSADLVQALAGTGSRFRLLSMSSDRLYPPAQVAQLAAALPGNPEHTVIETWAGHDGFLTETAAVGQVLADFLAS